LSFQLKMSRSTKKTGSNVVLALDLSPDQLESLLFRSVQILKETHSYICAVKMNRQLVLPLGLFNGVQRILSIAQDLELPTIMDCKINDVGHTNRIIAEYYYKAGFDAVIANPFVGWEQGLRPVFEAANQMRRGVILLVYMSHKAAEEGYGQTIRNPKTKQLSAQYRVFAEKALSWKADGAVVGATFPEKIREVHEILKEEIPIYSPGVGAQGGDVEATLKSGARYLIVGRAITLSENPGETAKRIRDAAKHCLK
jgi:orotidine-5'-phosphate decarboxylase